MMLPTPTWTSTEDPKDPCTYCVQWFTPEQFAGFSTPEIGPNDDPCEEMNRMAPYMPGGPVSRLYVGVHKACAAAVDAHNAHREIL